MFYTLKSNVYLVKGKARSCVYDFNSFKLYSVNDALAEIIEKASISGINSNAARGELKQLFEEFIRNGIFVLSDTVFLHEIDEIKKPDNGCTFAWIEITNRCNLRCLHCYNESDIHCDIIMSLCNYKKAIDKSTLNWTKRCRTANME